MNEEDEKLALLKMKLHHQNRELRNNHGEFKASVREKNHFGFFFKALSQDDLQVQEITKGLAWTM